MRIGNYLIIQLCTKQKHNSPKQDIFLIVGKLLWFVYSFGKYANFSQNFFKKEFFKKNTFKVFGSIFRISSFSVQCSKIEKKCNFKSAKKHFLLFQKWQKINFCTRKKFKITKNVIFGLKKKNRIFGTFKLFSVAKNWVFLHF